jgi:hypothetical protein
MSEIRPLHEHRCQLGESPVWSAAERALWWVDIPGRELLRWRDGELTRWPQAAEPGCLALHADGCPRVARRDGLFRFDPATGESEPLAAPPYDPGRQRFNDGKVGPDGAWWIGTLSDARLDEAGLYRWDGRQLRLMAEGVAVSNGLAWSPDAGSMYWADTKAHRVDRLVERRDPGRTRSLRPVAAARPFASARRVLGQARWGGHGRGGLLLGGDVRGTAPAAPVAARRDAADPGAAGALPDHALLRRRGPCAPCSSPARATGGRTRSSRYSRWLARC